MALELLCKCYSVDALMADDMGKIDKSEPCVNISRYAARDGVSKSVTELTTTRQSLNQTVEGVSTAWCHHNTLKPGPIEQLMTVILNAFHLKKISQFR